MKKKFIFLILLLFPISTYGSYGEIDYKIKSAYSKIYAKIYAKNKSDKGLNFLKNLQKSLNTISDSSKVSAKNSSILFDLQRLNNEKIFVLELEKKKKELEKMIKENSVLQKFENKIYDSKDYISLENGVWYFYLFENYYNIGSPKDVTEKFVNVNNLSYKNSIIFIKDSKISFLKKYQKFKLISNDIIYGIPNKNYMINLLKKYKFRIKTHEDLDSQIIEIKQKTKEITKNIYKNDKKIEKIYDFILNNVEYATNYTFENPDFFSGVKTFKNKSGVCEGYVELFNFMLSFSMINSKMLTGDVINAPDFGNIGHAWVKIGDYYYDPTFDDPTGLDKTRKKSEYLYYKLPKDLFYTNRFNYGYTPDSLKNTDLEYREKLIRKNIANLYDKYKNKGYNILNETSFRKENGISSTKTLEISDLIKILGPANTTNLKTVVINGEKKNFKKILYIKLEDNPEIINAFLISENYKLDGYKIFKVNKDGEEFFAASKEYSFY